MGASLSSSVGCVKKPKSKAKVVGSKEKYFRFGQSIKTLMETKTAYKTTTPQITTSYFGCIREINETAKGINFLYHEAEKSVHDNMKSNLDVHLESMLTRASSLRQEVIILLEKSIYNIDLLVEERKEQAEGIYLMLEDLEIAIKKSFESLFYLNDVRKIVKKISTATENLAKLH